MKDLIVLTADKNTEFLLKGLLPRIPAIEKIKPFTFDIYVHIHKDPGVYNTSHEFLRSFCKIYTRALVLFDLEGCGHDSLSRENIEFQIEKLLYDNGWHDRCGVVVISPEIENWIWVNSVHIKQAITWEFQQDIYEWLCINGFKEPNLPKPKRPKEAFEAILYRSNTPRSSSIYKELAENASYKPCIDPAFLKMMDLLKTWFS